MWLLLYPLWYLNIVKPLGKPSKKALTLRYLHGSFQNETFPFWILRFRDLGESWAWLWDMGFRLGIAIGSQERVSTWSNNKIPFGKASYYIQLFYIFLYFPCLFCKIVNLLFSLITFFFISSNKIWAEKLAGYPTLISGYPALVKGSIIDIRSDNRIIFVNFSYHYYQIVFL